MGPASPAFVAGWPAAPSGALALKGAPSALQLRQHRRAVPRGWRAARAVAVGAPVLVASLCVGQHAVARGRARRCRQECRRRRGPGRFGTPLLAARGVADDEEGVDFEVTPWGGDVEPRPIVVVSDGTGGGARRLVESAWAQFGSTEAAELAVLPEVRTEEDVKAAVERARSAGPQGDMSNGALVIFTLAASGMNTQLLAACRDAGVPCVDALQPLLVTLEEVLGCPRLGNAGPEGAAEAPAAAAPVFVVSDSSGSSAYALTRHALRQFPASGIAEVTVCPSVRSLEEARLVASEAGSAGGIVAFTFASTGMSRFMRQQCEQAGARYVDLYQPVLLAMEIYLDHPSIGVPGGYSESLAASRESWETRSV